MSGRTVILDREYVKLILAFLKDCIDKKIAPFYVNKLLRDDVMSILENNSIVVYYPLDEDEENNGFLVRGLTLCGESEARDFVFINTAKDTEKQAFAAAHELGHIWGLDKFFKENGIELDYDADELVMNRFAAELMIPKDQFQEHLNTLLKKTGTEVSGKGSLVEQSVFFHIVAELMNEFFVPDKAIILRLLELSCIQPSTAEFLIEDLKKTEASIVREHIEKSIQDAGYSKLLRPTNKKWINDLPALLAKAEEKGALTESKIKVMKERFNITQATPDAGLHNIELSVLRNGGGES